MPPLFSIIFISALMIFLWALAKTSLGAPKISLCTNNPAHITQLFYSHITALDRYAPAPSFGVGL